MTTAPKFSIERFDTETLPSGEIANKIAQVFLDNHPGTPAAETAQERDDHRDGPQAIETIKKHNYICFIARDTQDQVLGLLQMRVIDLRDNVEDAQRNGKPRLLIQLVWIMVDQTMRGRGVASPLHEAFEREAGTIVEGIDLDEVDVSQQLAVAVADTRAQEIYKHWGYREMHDDEGNRKTRYDGEIMGMDKPILSDT